MTEEASINGLGARGEARESPRSRRSAVAPPRCRRPKGDAAGGLHARRRPSVACAVVAPRGEGRSLRDQQRVHVGEQVRGERREQDDARDLVQASHEEVPEPEARLEVRVR